MPREGDGQTSSLMWEKLGGGDSTAEDQLVCLPRAGTISWTWGSVSSRASPASAVWQVFSERVTHPLHAPCWVAGFQPAYEGKVTSSQQSWEIRKEKSNALKNVNSGVSLPVFKITVYILPPSTKDLKQLMSISTNSRALTRHWVTNCHVRLTDNSQGAGGWVKLSFPLKNVCL